MALNCSSGMNIISENRSRDLYYFLAIDPKIGQIDPFSPLENIHFICTIYIDSNSIPNHENSIPSPPTFTVSVDGNFHAFPWLEDYYLIFENIGA